MQIKTKTKNRWLTCVVLAVVLTMCAVVPAFATFVYGPTHTQSVNGVTYTTQAEIGTGDGSVINGYGLVNASRTVSAGTMGATISVYAYTTQLIAQNTAYNSYDMQYFIAYTSGASRGFSIFYGKGTGYAWNGSGYTDIPIRYTPNAATRSVEAFAVSSYPVNESGMTYGSGLSTEYVGMEPDLVAAIGNGGVDGYVKSADLEIPVPSSPEEAVSLYGATGVKTIPVYDLDGTTIVDQFDIELGGGSEGDQSSYLS